MNDKFYDYVDGKLISIKISSFWEFLNLPQEEYENVLLGVSYHGIPLPEFVYALLNFFKGSNDKKTALEQKRYNELLAMNYIDCEAINMYQTTIDPQFGHYEINPELEKKLDLVMEKGNNAREFNSLKN